MGEKILNLDCIGVPVRQERIAGAAVKHPHAHAGEPRPDRLQELPGPRGSEGPVRFGFFNLFNQAFANTGISNDISLTLNTVCNVRGCTGRPGRYAERLRPDQGHYDQQTIDNFGKINLKRGHRVVEFVLNCF